MIISLYAILLILSIKMCQSMQDRNTNSIRRKWNTHQINRRVGPGMDPDRVVFPDENYDEIMGNMDRSIKNITRNELPLNLALRLSELEDVSVFMEEVLENKDKFYNDNGIGENIQLSIVSRFGSTTKSAKGGISIKQVCSPVMTTIRLAPESHPGDVLYLPECAHVKRCSGCCNTALLSCQPTKKNNVTFRIFESKLSANRNKLRYSKTYDIEVEEHLSCGCRCKVQAHHCQTTQRYDSGSCRCVCKDEGSEGGKDECEANGKTWDDTSCACECPEEINQLCSTMSNFDDDLCSCVIS